MKNYIIMATDEFIYDRFQMEFAKFKNVTIHYGLFEQLSNIDCLVSPANSFGLMDGGMDLAIIKYFGLQLQERVQKRILEQYYGEQHVGSSFIIETNNDTIPFLAHSPTMRIPMDISSTDNVYTAMRSTLIESEKHEEINTIAIPAFGYGVGKVHASDVAYQMAKAYLQIAAQPKQIDWNYAGSINYAIQKYN